MSKQVKKSTAGSSKEPRPFDLVSGGKYDKMGFYVLPDGDFYDPDGYYFNRDGFDEFGGQYSEKGIYIPGPGNKHEFIDEDEFDNDPLVKAFERGDQIDDHVDDRHLDKYIKQYKQAKHLVDYGDEEEFEQDQDLLDYYGQKGKKTLPPSKSTPNPRPQLNVSSQDFKPNKKVTESQPTAPQKQEQSKKSESKPVQEEQKKEAPQQQATKTAANKQAPTQQPAPAKAKLAESKGQVKAFNGWENLFS